MESQADCKVFWQKNQTEIQYSSSIKNIDSSIRLPNIFYHINAFGAMTDFHCGSRSGAHSRINPRNVGGHGFIVYGRDDDFSGQLPRSDVKNTA